MSSRPASHAGSWYSASSRALQLQLDQWLSDVNTDKEKNQEGETNQVHAVIVPHAGYSYSGPTAAWSYRALQEISEKQKIRRIFILGPSHHGYFRSCALPTLTTYDTPLGPLAVDMEVVQKLKTYHQAEFINCNPDWEVAEHSIEMQLPYLYRIFSTSKHPIPLIVPIMVGSVSPTQENTYGKILAPYLEDSVFVISSDFCHWGQRFQYYFLPDHQLPIHESIAQLDHQAMRLIENQDMDGFYSYLKETGNTICGRHPIAVLLHALKHWDKKAAVQFVHYAQSSPAQSKQDSSVSYAAGVISADVE